HHPADLLFARNDSPRSRSPLLRQLLEETTSIRTFTIQEQHVGQLRISGQAQQKVVWTASSRPRPGNSLILPLNCGHLRVRKKSEKVLLDCGCLRKYRRTWLTSDSLRSPLSPNLTQRVAVKPAFQPFL